MENKSLVSHCRTQGLLVDCRVEILDIDKPESLSAWHQLELAKLSLKGEDWLPINVTLKGQEIEGMAQISFRPGMKGNEIIKPGDVRITTFFSVFLDPFSKDRIANILWRKIVKMSLEERSNAAAED